MKTKLFICILMSLFVVQACYEDKGNYDYITPNKIQPKSGSFKNYPTKAYLGEVYKYYPQLEYSNPNDTTHFEFWWEFTGILNTQGYDTLCIGRELNFIPNVADYINMRLCALDNQTGIVSSFALQIQSVSAVAKGWAILSEKNGKSCISLIRPEYKEETIDGQKIKTRFYTPFLDIYETLQGESLGTDPVQIRQLLNSNGEILFVLQKHDPLYLNGASYANEMSLEKEFPGGMPANLVVKDFYYGASTNALLSENGDLYIRTTLEQSEFQPFYRVAYPSIPLEYQGEKVKATSLIPTIGTKAMCFGIYEASKKRILWMITERYKGGFMSQLNMPEWGEDEMIIDPRNMGDWEMIYSSAFSETYSNFIGKAYYLCLFKKGNEMVAEQFSTNIRWGSYDLINFTDFKATPFPGKDYTTENTKYYMLKTRPYLFFAEKNVVYWYDLTSGIVKKDFYQFPEGSVIVDMSSNPQENELGVILEDGTFAVLNIANDKLYDGIKIWSTTGLGKCVDLEYKFGTYSQYSDRTASYNWD